jgi:hypothetical protein
MPGSPQCSLSLRFPHQNPVYASPLPHTCYMPHPSPQFYYLQNSGWAIQIIKLLRDKAHNDINSHIIHEAEICGEGQEDSKTWPSPRVTLLSHVSLCFHIVYSTENQTNNLWQTGMLQNVKQFPS